MMYKYKIVYDKKIQVYNIHTSFSSIEQSVAVF